MIHYPGSGYKLPPDEITKIVDAPAEPGLTYSPDRKHFLQMFRPPALPSILEMARPELKIAGVCLLIPWSPECEWRKGRCAFSNVVGTGLTISETGFLGSQSTAHLCTLAHSNAGLRIDPDLFARSKMGHSTGLVSKPVFDGSLREH